MIALFEEKSLFAENLPFCFNLIFFFQIWCSENIKLDVNDETHRDVKPGAIRLYTPYLI